MGVLNVVKRTHQVRAKYERAQDIAQLIRSYGLAER